jgi:signal transduction histidine kinase
MYRPSDDAIFIDYIKKELLLKPDFPKHSERLGKKITESIFELYENARTHGKCKFIHVCGQYFPNKEHKPMHITIVDRGISIRKNVRDFLGAKSLSGKEAIKWAMQYGNTTKIGTSGGLGLDIIFEFVKLNKGKIQIISSNGYWEYNNEVITSESFENSFVGTIANIKFNLDDSSYYYLKEEENLTLDDLF